MISFVPQKTPNPTQAWELLTQQGAVILVEPDTTPEGSLKACHQVLGTALQSIGDAFPVKAGHDPRITYSPSAEPLPSHTDGFGYGGGLGPDYIGLHCIIQSAQGGDSYLLDGYALLEKMSDQPEHEDLLDGMWSEAIDQTKTGREPYIGPLLRKTSQERVWIRHHPLYLEPAPDATDPAHQQQMIERWQQLLDQENEAALRFKLEPGDLLFLDNYRCLHGRDAFGTEIRSERLLHRIWMWSTACAGIPERTALSAV